MGGRRTPTSCSRLTMLVALASLLIWLSRAWNAPRHGQTVLERALGAGLRLLDGGEGFTTLS